VPSVFFGMKKLGGLTRRHRPPVEVPAKPEDQVQRPFPDFDPPREGLTPNAGRMADEAVKLRLDREVIRRSMGTERG